MSRRRAQETIEQAEYVTISELVRLTGIRYSTLKYYSEEALLHFHQEDTRLTRRYHRVNAIARLEEITQLKKQELSIQEIREKLSTINKID